MEHEIQLALLQQKIEQDEIRISRLEDRLEELDKKVLKGQMIVLALAAIGGIVGWIITVSDKVRAWFH